MLGARATRTWSRVHTWSSLICTAFLFLLCVTGLPLIFHDEIDQALGYGLAGEGGQAASVDRVVQAGLAARPGKVVQYVVWEPNKPGVITLSMGTTASSAPAENENVFVDAATARVLSRAEADRGPMDFILRLHSQLLLGAAGAYAMGLVAITFLVALVSGVVLYGPFMRRLAFGTVRHDRSQRARQLDLHNLLGVAIVAWMLVVGATGIINAWGGIIFQGWRMGQLAELTADYRGRPTPGRLASVDLALATALRAVPNADPYIVAFPQSLMSSAHHYGVFMRGRSPHERYLLTPALVDAADGASAVSAEVPLFIKGLLLSQPLHFGDYGGWVLKILWAVLDLVTLHVLGTGLYLWASRRRNAKTVEGLA